MIWGENKGVTPDVSYVTRSEVYYIPVVGEQWSV